MEAARPLFSIVMPTFNRSDTLARAVASVRAQRVDDWELLVVDDGSADGTAELLASIPEPRLRVLRQPNEGVASARNAGLRAARGALLAFLDSDDEWPPHHLALAAAFFRALPREQVYTAEVWQDWGPGTEQNATLEIARRHAPGIARRAGSRRFAAPPPRGDPYLWYFAERAPAGEWATAVLGPALPPPLLYRGMLFDHWRWGWMSALTTAVVTRRAVDAVGPFDLAYRVASDYGWLARLARSFPTSFLAVPGVLKHERVNGRERPREEHLVYGGKYAVDFRRDVLRQFEELFARGDGAGAELAALRGQYQHFLAEAALLNGDPALAREQGVAAAAACPCLRTRALAWTLRGVADGARARRVWAAWTALSTLPARARSRWARLRAGRSAW